MITGISQVGHVITQVLISDKQRQGAILRHPENSSTLELVLEKYKQPTEAGKGPENNFPLELPGRNSLLPAP